LQTSEAVIQFEIGPLSLAVTDDTAWCGVESAIYIIDLEVRVCHSLAGSLQID